MPSSTFIKILIFIGFLLYSTTFLNQFVWDDEQFIQKNEYIRSFKYILQIFSTNTIAGAGHNSNYYRPLTTLSFTLDYTIWGLNPFGYHLTNTILHVATAVLFFALLSRLGAPKNISFLVSLFFLIHPIQTEAVTYINSRGDSLYALLLFLSLFLFSSPASKKILLVPIFFTMSVLAKEIALASAPIFGLMYFIKRKTIPRQAVLTLASLFIITAGYIILRLTVLNFSNSLNFYPAETEYTSSLLIRLFTFAKVIWIYIGLIIFPYPLHMERDTELVGSFMSPYVFASIILAVGVLGSAIYEIKKHKSYLIILGTAISFFTLAPVSGIIPINGILYEHWLYVPMLGFFLIIFGLFHTFVPKNLILKSKKPLLFLVISMSMTYSILTIRQNFLWSTPITFYEYTLQYAKSARLYNNLAMAYSEEKQYDKAIENYKGAIEFSDTYPQTHHNLGNTYFALGEYKKAEKEYLRALEIDPNFSFTYSKLEELYSITKQLPP